MKYRLLTLIAVLAVIAGAFGLPAPVKAVSYGAQFVTSVTYMNVDAVPVAVGDLEMLFYAAGSSSSVSWKNTAQLPVHAASSLYAGSVFSGSFSGSVVVSSSAKLAVTAVQTSTTVKNRMLSNGFSSGAATFTIPTVLKNTADTNSVFSIQNADIVANDVTVTFTPISGTPWNDPVISALPSGAAKIYDMGTYAIPGGATTFNGSVTITAKQTGSSAAGAVVAASQEFNLVNDNVYAFEGVTNGGPKLYMPSAMCNLPPGNATSAYAIMNMGTDTINVSVVYKGGGTASTTGLTPGKKFSFNACTVNTNGYIGSAVVTATHVSGTGTPQIVGIGKIFNGGISTAFSGVTTGSQILALPYVRYTNAGWADQSKQRVFIAIQNVTGTGSAALPIGSVTVTFYNSAGAAVGSVSNTVALSDGDKFSVNPNQLPNNSGAEFGYGTPTGGGAIITGPANSKLAVVARAQTYLTSTTATGEDYNGIPVQ